MKKLIGTISSQKMNKTKIVSIKVKKRHPIYHKTYYVVSKIMAHDEKGEYQTGDVVEIESTRPQSHKKSWKIIRKIS